MTRGQAKQITSTIFTTVSVKQVFQDSEQNEDVDYLIDVLVTHIEVDVSAGSIRTNKLRLS
jgi:hypothetical protein